MKRKLLKIKIGMEHTTIQYNEKIFRNRTAAIQGAINHLQRMLDEGAIPDD